MMKMAATLLFLLLMKGVKSVGLYSSDDDVISLDIHNMAEAVTEQPHAWMVEFYASWCGHCHHFAPFYKQFAKEILPWQRIIKVGAVDCADTRNEDICIKYKITGYPSIKYISPNASADDIGVPRNSWDKSVDALKSDTIFYIQAIQWELNITDWPNLDPVQGPFESLLEYEGKREMFIILEDEDSITGREVLLDLHGSYEGTENIARMEVKNPYMNDDIKNILSNSDLPALIQIEAGRPFIEVLRTTVSAEEAETIIYNYYNGILGAPDEEDHEQPDEKDHEQPDQDDLDQPDDFMDEDDFMESTERPVSDVELKRRRYTVSLRDLEKTVLYALTHEVTSHVDLTSEKQAALKDFIKVLADFFPSSSNLVSILIQLSSMDQLSIENLEEMLGELSEVYEKYDWKSCRGSKPEFGGYPCGQWMLWHTLTVEQMKEGKGDPRQVLHAMNGFIKHFFGCRECSKHFVNMTHNGQGFKSIKTYQDSVLYLWEKHNIVNDRLSGDASDDPRFPKSRFPSAEECSSCYTANGQPARDQILSFLKDMYGSTDVTLNGSTAILFDAVYSMGLLLGAMLT